MDITYQYEDKKDRCFEVGEGLSEQEIQERREQGLVNARVDSSTKSVKEIVLGNTLTYFNLIFLIIAILLTMVGSYRDLTFLPIIIANTLIGIIQELKSKKVLDELSILSEPKASVIRSGEEVQLSVEELVQDDLVIFKAGGQICADAVVVSGETMVNESLLTGESDEICKKTGDELLSGSFIVSGECRARLTRVGKDSYISKLTLEATKHKKGEQSEMIRSLNRLVMLVGIIILPIGFLLFSQQYFYQGATMKDSVTGMVAAVIGMIPEGLYLLATVALVVSTMRLAHQKVLVHDMKCIETLARVDVLCVDKTGTITENTMSVHKVVYLGGGNGPEIGGDNLGEEEIDGLLGDFAAAMSSDNITMEAVKKRFTAKTGKGIDQVLPFSSKVKYSAVSMEDVHYVLGAPEWVLRDGAACYQDSIAEYMRQGFRVLVFAIYQGNLTGEALMAPCIPLAFLLLSNPVRKEAKGAFTYFAEQGVEIKVISGDNPGTVSEAAKEAGISGAERYVDASILKTEEDFREAVECYTVFGRVTPQQKRQLVKALKQQGHTVAMTGDGVNDVLALKDADCSVAMASGSEAAAQVAQLVLLHSDFSRMPSIVMEGRRVVNNIERTASLFLVKNIFSFLMALFSVFSMLHYPLEPSQISLISMFTIGIPGFLFALEKNKKRISGRFLSNVLMKALPAGITDFLVVSALTIFCIEFNVDASDLSTSCTILLGVVGIMILYRMGKPITLRHGVLIVSMALGLVGCMLFVSPVFGITSISRRCGMLLILFAIITEPLLRYLSLLIESLQKVMLQLSDRIGIIKR